VALDASLRSFASLRMTAIVVGGNEKAPANAGAFSFVPDGESAAGGLVCFRLFGGHFFGFAFLAHHFQFALGFFEGGLYFLLDLGCRFFELR
jgi:hypothetical protein